MPRIIFKCPYLKSGNTAHKENMVEYIAIRNGVERLTVRNKEYPVTQKQEEFVKQILKEFPSTKNLFEYEDYIQNKTLENATEFINIALEQNLDTISKKENYVDYIANRPRVEKLSSHGLFTSGNEKIVLSKVAEEVANHDGNVWLPIISLRREDAVNTGFDNAERWKDFLSAYAPTIAENLKIPLDKFRWYASFHNESHHPHIHMICYSENPKQGYLSQKGIEKIKSGLVSNIFQQEMKEIYAQQTIRRDELKVESKKALQNLVDEISKGNVQNPQLEMMLTELAEKLKHTKGKRVYGYLSTNIKTIVDNITDELTKEKSVAENYKLWQETRNEVFQSYTDKISLMLPLSQQKEFKSIKNLIISEADKLSICEISLSELEEDEISEEQQSHKSTKDYVKAKNILKKEIKTQGEMQTAINHFTSSAEQGNQYAQYILGKMHLMGQGLDKNKETATKWFTLSAEEGNEYAKFFLDTMNKWKEPSLSFAVSRLFHHMSRMFENALPPPKGSVGLQIDSKRMRKLREKKMAQGHKRDDKEPRLDL